MSEEATTTFTSAEDVIAHYGIMGMKWGVRKEKLTPNKSDSRTTKRVKADYNNLSDSGFQKKYKVSKDRYSKRVEKYGDPYMNSPLAKIGKKLASDPVLAKKNAKLDAKFEKQADKFIRSMKPWNEAADAMEAAVDAVMEQGYRTPDLYAEGLKKVSTSEMGHLVAQELLK